MSSLPETLRLYYSREFPFELLTRWLSYRTRSEDPQFFRKREFSFTLRVLDDEIYCRYKSFASGQDFQQAVCASSEVPEKIDIGAVFSIPPSQHQLARDAFRPLLREYVLDVDMDEYDDVRTCCSGANVCRKCWQFIAAAVEILNFLLEEDFGFRHRIFFFSGRRGVHCWVSDYEARTLSDRERSGVTDYLNLVVGQKVRLQIPPKLCDPKEKRLSPSLKKCVDICREYVEKPEIGILDGQNPLITKLEKLEKVLPEKARKEFRSKKNNSREIFEHFRQLVKKHSPTSLAVEELIMELCYPRLDTNVSKQMNHLLKSPFCIHPKTGKVCVPLDVSRIRDFDPDLCPTIDSSLRNNDELRPYLKYFEKFVSQVEAGEAKLHAEKDTSF